jgi:hypothetical protein
MNRRKKTETAGSATPPEPSGAFYLFLLAFQRFMEVSLFKAAQLGWQLPVQHAEHPVPTDNGRRPEGGPGGTEAPGDGHPAQVLFMFYLQ